MSVGHEITSRRLLFNKVEHPIIAQIWGMIPENYYNVAKQLNSMDFDGIDINMGCPQHDVVSHGACGALIKNHSLAKEIISATKDGVGDLPVSVKTRIGYKTIQTEEWIEFLLEQDLSLITIHGRTVYEMSKVPVHWDEIAKAVQLRNAISKNNLIFGNGDVTSLQEAKEKVEKYHVDGVMIGRGIFHNPWLFKEIDPSTKILKDRLLLLKQHVKMYQDTWGSNKSYQVLKKYFKIYLSDFEGASELRQKFMETNSYDEALLLVDTLLV